MGWGRGSVQWPSAQVQSLVIPSPQEMHKHYHYFICKIMIIPYILVAFASLSLKDLTETPYKKKSLFWFMVAEVNSMTIALGPQ